MIINDESIYEVSSLYNLILMSKLSWSNEINPPASKNSTIPFFSFKRYKFGL